MLTIRQAEHRSVQLPVTCAAVTLHAWLLSPSNARVIVVCPSPALTVLHIEPDSPVCIAGKLCSTEAKLFVLLLYCELKTFVLFAYLTLARIRARKVK